MRTTATDPHGALRGLPAFHTNRGSTDDHTRQETAARVNKAASVAKATPDTTPPAKAMPTRKTAAPKIAKKAVLARDAKHDHARKATAPPMILDRVPPPRVPPPRVPAARTTVSK